MAQIRRRLFSFLLAVCMITTLLPTAAGSGAATGGLSVTASGGSDTIHVTAAPGEENPQPGGSASGDTLSLFNSATTIARAYDQKVTVTVRNTSEQAVKYHLECENPYEDIYMNFVSSGSKDAPLTIPAGGTQDVVLNVFAQNAKRTNYTVQVTAVVEGDESVRMALTFNCQAAAGTVSFQKGDVNSATLTTTYTVTNTGTKSITDLTLALAGEAADYVRISPSVENYEIAPNGTVTVKLIPDLGKMKTNGKTVISGQLIALGGAEGTEEVSFDTQGQEISSLTLAELALRQEENPYPNMQVSTDEEKTKATLGAGDQLITDIASSMNYEVNTPEKVQQVYDVMFDENGMFELSMDTTFTYGDGISRAQGELPTTLHVKSHIATPEEAGSGPVVSTSYNEQTHEFTYNTTVYMTRAEYAEMVEAFKTEAETELLGARISSASPSVFSARAGDDESELEKIGVDASYTFISEGTGWAVDNLPQNLPGMPLLYGFNYVNTAVGYVEIANDVVDFMAYYDNPRYTQAQKEQYLAAITLKAGMTISSSTVIGAMTVTWDGPGFIAGCALYVVANYLCDKWIDSLGGSSGGLLGLFFGIFGSQCTNAGQVTSDFYVPDFEGVDYSKVKVHETSRMYDGSPYGGNAGYAEDQFGGDRYVHDREVQYTYSLNGTKVGETKNSGLTALCLMAFDGTFLRPGRNSLVRKYNTNAGHYSVTADTEITILYPADTKISYIGTPTGLEDVRLLPDFAVYEENILPQSAIVGEQTQVTVYVYNRGSRGGKVDITISDSTKTYATETNVYIDAFSEKTVTFSWTPTAGETNLQVSLTNKTIGVEERKTTNNTATRTIHARTRQTPVISSITPTNVVLEGTSVRFIAEISDIADVTEASFTVDGTSYTGEAVTLTALTGNTAQAAVNVSGLTAGEHTVTAAVTYKTGAVATTTVEKTEKVNVRTPSTIAFQIDQTVTNPSFTVVREDSRSFTRMGTKVSPAENGYAMTGTADMTANPQKYYLVTACSGGLIVSSLSALNDSTLSLSGGTTVQFNPGDGVSIGRVLLRELNGKTLTSLEVSPDAAGALRCVGVRACEMYVTFTAAGMTKTVQVDVADTTADRTVNLADYYKLYRIDLPSDRGYRADTYFYGTLCYTTASGTKGQLSVARNTYDHYGYGNDLAYDAAKNQLVILIVSSGSELSTASEIKLLLSADSNTLYAVDLTGYTEAVTASWNHQPVTYTCSGANGLSVSSTQLKLKTEEDAPVDLWGMPLYLPAGSYDFLVNYEVEGQQWHHTGDLTVADQAVTVDLPGLDAATATVVASWPSLWNSSGYISYDIEDAAGNPWRANASVRNGGAAALPAGEQTLDISLSRGDLSAPLAYAMFTADVTLAEGTSTNVVIGSAFTGTASISDDYSHPAGSYCFASLSELKDENGIVLKSYSAYYTQQTAGNLNGLVTLTKADDPSKQYTAPFSLNELYDNGYNNTISFRLPADMETGDYTYEVFLTTEKIVSGQYTITFDPDGGSGAMADQRVDAGETYTLPACGFGAPAGKVFDAWQIDSVRYAPGDRISVEANLTVTALWKDAPYVEPQPQEEVLAPAVTPDGGEFSGALSVSMACGTDGASIYYTIDGTTPSRSSVLYTGPFMIYDSVTVKAVAVKDGMKDSPVASASFTRIGGGSYDPGYSPDDDGGYDEEDSNAGSGAPPSSSGNKVAHVAASHGTVTSSPSEPKQGDTVTLTVKPESGYELTSLLVRDARGVDVPVTKTEDGHYTFVMPSGKVTVTPVFAKAEAAEPPAAAFADVPAGAYYYDAVAWAVEQGITTGTSAGTFDPEASCTRAQMVTFLWRAAGSPAPQGGAVPFTDLPSDAYYRDAVLWAVEQGITNGTSADAFSPDAVVTRAQTVTFLYRAANAQAAGGSSPFADVASGAYYAGAVQWAVDKGVTNGTGASTFSPDDNCTRAQIVTFLYRDRAN